MEAFPQIQSFKERFKACDYKQFLSQLLAGDLSRSQKLD